MAIEPRLAATRWMTESCWPPWESPVGFLAVLVLALYINTDTAQSLYGRYQLMWFLCPLLLYWISHIWLIAHRGKMPDDPVVFAIRDRTSRILILLMLAATLLAL